jgi:hypothetical protein
MAGALIGGLLLKPSTWGFIAIAGMAATIGIQQLVLNHDSAAIASARQALINPADKHTWQADALQAEQDLGECQTNETALKASIASQNAAVAALQAESVQRTQQAQAAVQQAHTALAKAQAYASQIATETSGADKCGSALNLLRSP